MPEELFASESLLTPEDLLRGFREAARSGRSVLVVDDDPGVCRLIQRTLARRLPDVRVRCVTRGADALAAVGEEWPDAVLLDVYVPDVHGQVIASFLRRSATAEHPLHLIAMSGVRPEETEAKALAWAPDAFLEKPLDLDAMTRVVRRALARDGTE